MSSDCPKAPTSQTPLSSSCGLEPNNVLSSYSFLHTTIDHSASNPKPKPSHPSHRPCLKPSGQQGINNQDSLSGVSRTHLTGLPGMSKQAVNFGVTFDLGRQRTKRSSFPHTGAKVCSDDSIAEVLASHQAYFKLRVCQVSVWEAFRVFLDRVPSSTEYDTWVSACQRDSLCMTDLLRSFSASQEHMDVVSKVGSAIRGCKFTQLESTFLNTLPEQPVEQVVEFSVTVVDPGFSELLNDTNNPQYYDFTRGLHNKMLHVFDKLPGFKEFRVLGFRAGGISVRYAIVFETDMVDVDEVGDGSAEAAEERGGLETEDMANSHLKQIVTKALSEEKSLPVDVDSICFHPEAFTVSGATKASNSRLLQTTSAAATWPPSEVIAEQQPMDNVNMGIPHTPASPQGEETTREIPTPHATTEPTTDHVTSITQASAVTVPLKEAVKLLDETTGFPSEVKDVTPALSSTDAPEKEPHRGGLPSQTLAPPPKVADTMDFQRKYPAETDQPVENDVSTHDPSLTTDSQNKEVVVFFSLRVTNMMFTSDLFNKSSPEYRSLENTFLEVTQISDPKDSPNPGASSKSQIGRQRTLASIPLLPYLQSNLTGFKELEILNFRNGSIIVNSKMKFADSVPYNVTEAVHCVLQDFCNAASKRLDIEIDSRSLDIEAADQGDPCRFTACNEFSRCVVNRWTQEPECLCDPGYITVSGTPCQSVCTLEPDYCLNGGQCEIVPGHGAACRCPVGKYWHFHGERCTELVSVPVDPFLFVICFVGFLLFVLAVIGLLVLINRKCIRTRKTVTLVHTRSPFLFGNTMRVNPVFESDESTLTRVSSLNCTSSSGTSSSRLSERDTLDSIEHDHLNITIPRQLYTTRPDKLVSEMVDFHHCMPFHEWRLPKEYRTSCCLLRTADNECSEVTVL
ncbi:interphotoreceptor matrix proteoglycan 1-like [Arapaima gigas]